MLIDTRIVVLMGHAGVGKTNVALHLARLAAEAGYATTIADLDTVNPYFRSSDYTELLDAWGVALEAPVFARTTLDTPSLTGRLNAIIERVAADSGGRAGSSEERLIIDVGGDDDGATTIGRFSRKLTEAGAEVLYVVSGMRALTPTPEDAAAMLPEIEAHAHLTATGVLNSTNLSLETTLETVRAGRDFAQACASLLGLPLVATAVPEVALRSLLPGQTLEETLNVAGDAHEELIVLPKYVGIPWE